MRQFKNSHSNKPRSIPVDEIRKIKKRVLNDIKPKREDIKAINDISDEIIGMLRKKADEMNLEADVILVGSASRDTWVSNGEKRDIDIFALFPEKFDEDFLEETGLFLIEEAMQGWMLEKRYAEHPYIHAFLEKEVNGEEMSFEIDLVPCFDVKDPSEIKSAVDRTPYHNRYVKRNIKGKEDEVRILKKFLEILGVYGSDTKTHGFSGYLCELLIIKYGKFEDLLIEASRWKPETYIDLEGHGRYERKEPLIVIDPVDPKRNVAAALSLNNLSIFIDAAREFLKRPDESYFQKREVEIRSEEELLKIFSERGTHLNALSFKRPLFVEDIIYPQLERTIKGIRRKLEELGFKVMNAYIYADSKDVLLLFEFEVWALPRTKNHLGPKVFDWKGGESFKRKNKDFKIYIEGGRYVADKPRKFTTPREFLEKDVLKCALGKNVRESIKEGYELLDLDEILKRERMRRFLLRYLLEV